MKLLLDTHTLLWLVEGDAKLTERAADVVADSEAELFLSPASCWELGIKVGLGKIQLQEPLVDYLHDAVRLYELTVLPIGFAHVARVATLPHHHKDPFDRLLVAQALENGLTLLSGDKQLDAYGVARIW
ncbi:type II toxin-antitoxin system VapC family toxin [Botrimarina mediterranea]|uniref:Ribonuclease VapC22 n=1 Tax=Botrimarina mediterranea TaxID=2528022 RepID=A0A518K9C7_9BACT|nr:type II toxin-antitoxin system VapC family toxin [Botrimarina mediterranea]QDV74399.1 Ribonuclease VapC22 [Botrimarina mediterranea]QDV78995.1 Ribonuclease VapC22 [Planctomycetes bacterium K2D]